MIEVGDDVIIQFTRNNVFYFQQGKSTTIHAVVVHVPYDVGDHWLFRDGDFHFTVNPLCIDFVGVVRELG